MEETQERRILIPDNEKARELVGMNDAHLQYIERSFPVKVVPRGNELIIKGAADNVEKVARLFERLMAIQAR